MKDIIDKVSSYNLFNNLFPGIIFVVLASRITSYNFIVENDVLGFFVYYFVGMVISRIGSLIIEKIFKKAKFVEFKPYKDYISASQQDYKIELLSETNNTYRTIIATMLALIIVKLYNILSIYFLFYTEVDFYIATSVVILLFSFSYKKQTAFISKRIDKANQHA